MEHRPDISYIVGFVLLMLFYMNPVVLISIAIIAGFVYFLTRTNHTHPDFNIQNQNKGTVYSCRMAALNNVKLYIAPYQSIWKNLRISNIYCTLRLGSDGRTITGSEKTSTNKYRKFRIIASHIHTMPELWNMFCLNFDDFTSYDGLLEMCNLFKAEYREEMIGGSSVVQKEAVFKTDSKNIDEKLDVNNASEVEITALPGISIVLSKKIIKRREEINGFKSVEELFLFLKLKPHMKNRLRPLICTKKMKGSVIIERNSERSVDL